MTGAGPAAPRRLVIAIDGPSGAGKSTIARAVARALGLAYVDTGAMYRAVAVEADRRGIGLEDSVPLAEMLDGLDLGFDGASDPARVTIGGRDVTEEIRAPRASMLASAYSALPAVRACLTRAQRGMGRAGGVVLEGRDIGSVVFPGADVKIYLDASPAERARRRVEQLRALGREAALDETSRAIEKRDLDDSMREHAPLRVAPGAIVLDTTGLGIDEVVAAVLAEARKPLVQAPGG